MRLLITNYKKFSIVLALAFSLTIATFGFLAWTASAHQDPSDCNASAIQQVPSVLPGGAVYDGSVLTYSVTYSNVGTGACNVTLADATIDLPGAGGIINVLTDATLNVGNSISCPGGAGCAAGPYTYPVNHVDEVGGSVTATFDIAGVLHQDADEEAASDHDTLSKTVIHPSTITSINSSSATVAAGGSVTLTVTEQNNGDVALTSPSVVVDNGVGTLIAPPTSGDTGADGILGVGETWSWTVNSGVINADTIFTATGHGTDSNNNDITWCANGGSQGTICDQDERDTVAVEVVTPLTVEKTANTTYDRDWDWRIDKRADKTDLLLAEGESFTVNYEVQVFPSSEDINHMVTGTITITNPAGNPVATVLSVSDALDVSGVAVVVCPGDPGPYFIASGGSLVCTYTKVGASPSDTENEATVVTDGGVPGGSDTAPVSYGAPVNVTDECVTVDDTNPGGPLGVVICEGDADKTIEYSVTFGPAGGTGVDVAVTCGEIDWPNTARFLTNDNQESGQDDWNVHVTVECDVGCTLTQGYWKTHSDKGPAPYDDNWANLGDWDGDEVAEQEDELLYDPNNDGIKDAGDVTWYEAFWTPPKKGNVWYQLAHQWMAAKLNVLNEASTTPAVDAALASGLTWLETHSPSAGTKGKDATDAAGWASTLGSYNEGLIGPGHCDEQVPNGV